MKEKIFFLIDSIPKTNKEITTNELSLLCVENPNLPNSMSEIYFLISLLKSTKVFAKDPRRGVYIIDHKRIEELKKRWGFE